MAGGEVFYDVNHGKYQIMGALGGFEWVIIILVLLLLFGARKIPGLARGIGQGLFEFRKAVKDGEDERADKQKDDNKNQTSDTKQKE